jgi:diacylglycerol kinase family enzyme
MSTEARRASRLPPVARRRLLLVANPHASTVSPRVKATVLRMLGARYLVDQVDTDGRDDATALTRAAAADGFDLVVTLGGDGTVNEAANGLAGSDTALACLPGGRTNVFSRALGGSPDLMEAAASLVRAADSFAPRRVDLGLMNGRFFAFASNVGFAAATNAHLDRRPRLKARFGERYYALAGLATIARHVLRGPPRLRVTAAGRSVEGVAAVVQNTDPLTYFGSRPVRIAEGAGPSTGTLSLTMLRRATPLEVLTVAPRALAGDAGGVAAHPQVEPFGDLRGARVEALGDDPLPVEVDGDYLGLVRTIDYGVAPAALCVLA